ncbi:hypothetical protein AURDEDRAFT_164117 [Auricularia subglabra TFB-10046 SS5]|nr:hypothetical protein AURDEDRAFT_164117 [Auricularia subglabra TFB-10046 SS5]
MHSLCGGITPHTPIPNSIPYPLSPACGFTIEDPAYVTPEMAALTYTRPHSTPSCATPWTGGACIST